MGLASCSSPLLVLVCFGCFSLCLLQSVIAKETTLTSNWPTVEATLYYEAGNSYRLALGHQNSNGIAWASFGKAINATGWYLLNLTVSNQPKYTDEQRYFAAGYLEGALTYDSIYDYYINFFYDLMGNYTKEQLLPVYRFINENDAWVRQQVKINAKQQQQLHHSTSILNDNNNEELLGTDEVNEGKYWKQVGLIMQQLDGMYEAYRRYAPPSKALTKLQLMLSNLDGDLFDLLPAFVPSSSTGPSARPHPGHCTSFIRFTGDELFCAHNTWDDFPLMLRIFKKYNFPTHDASVSAPTILFSGYPGCLSSLDDFYVLSSGLYVTETTNANFNMSLYDRLTTHSVMSWIRTIVANRLARSAKEWTDIYAMYNSGTYNNQWVVVDHNLFTAGITRLRPNTVWVLEQIPGYVEAADMSDFVSKNGFWGGYNVPWFKYIFDVMDYPAAVASQGLEYSQNCSRARIMRRDHSKLKTLGDVQRFMQYNEWQTDPLSSKNPCNSIAARCDLVPPYQAFGAYDAKVTSHKMVKELRAMAISGPTHQNQTPFVWSGNPAWSHEKHLGEPDRWQFNWIPVH